MLSFIDNFINDNSNFSLEKLKQFVENELTDDQVVDPNNCCEVILREK